ncbi:MAG: peptidoglycan DD-metalloendopeptidase family protein [Anaerolineae bacterium]|nr:peptidoglycan DD-metalloendopeptidase family protein [Anaerolineae bacterium]
MMKRIFAGAVVILTAALIVSAGFFRLNVAVAQPTAPTQIFLATNTPYPTNTPGSLWDMFPPTNTPGSLWDMFPPTNTPRAIASLTPLASATPMAMATMQPTAYIPPTFTPEGLAGATWTPPGGDPSTQIADHYYMSRPIGSSDVNYVAWTYPYGGTAGGRLQVHHGVDLVNNTGTPVLAAADGVVIYAGDDLSTLFGPYNNYYGNMIVIQHSFMDASGSAVFTLYGHLNQIEIATGEGVTAGQRIATVGGTGIAQGPHLHFEVRVGNPYDFGATRNPALWIYPYNTFGTLAGTVTDASGALLYDVSIIVAPSGGSTGVTRYAFSYKDNTVNGDSVFGENWVLGDIPAGYYTVTVSNNGVVLFRDTVYVQPNRSTWVDITLS